MKKRIYIKKLTFHNLFTGRITYKLHVDLLGVSFRIPYWTESLGKGHKKPFEIL
ncbi:MAG: hypothetical protein WCJ72_14090 [Chryseobacterium sp.]